MKCLGERLVNPTCGLASPSSTAQAQTRPAVLLPKAPLPHQTSNQVLGLPVPTRVKCQKGHEVLNFPSNKDTYLYL